MSFPPPILPVELLGISACADERRARNLAGVPRFLIRAPKRRGEIAEIKIGRAHV